MQHAEGKGTCPQGQMECVASPLQGQLLCKQLEGLGPETSVRWHWEINDYTAKEVMSNGENVNWHGGFMLEVMSNGT